MIGCHTSHEERDELEVPALKIGAGDCAECHHDRPSGGCLECHGEVLQRSYPVDLGDFHHTAHVQDMELACTLCHGDAPALHRVPDAGVCADCR